MSDEPLAPPPPPTRVSRRKKLVALAGLVVLAAGLLVVRLAGHSGKAKDAEPPPAPVVVPSKPKPELPQLGIEYHFDRNALVDSRAVGAHLVALTSSGNLVLFDGESFALQGEKVFRRRATCLGPVSKTHVVVGLSNGSVVRVATEDWGIEPLVDVPGVPRWIGERPGDGALVIAYAAGQSAQGALIVWDRRTGHRYPVGPQTSFLLDSKDRLWLATGKAVRVLDLAAGTDKEVALKNGLVGVEGFTELSDGQVWLFGGSTRAKESTGYVIRLEPGPLPVSLYPMEDKGQSSSDAAPHAPITQVVDDTQHERVLLVFQDGVAVSDRNLSTWKPLDAMAGAGHREGEARIAVGTAHLARDGVVVTLAQGGWLEVTADFSRRHALDGQDSVARPSEIARLMDGMAFYGDGGPLFYSGGAWRALPEAIHPPPELMGSARPGEKERTWAAMRTLPIEGEVSYVVAKAGAQRHDLGHRPGLRDVFLTARWDGQVLSVLGREELPLEPDDTFITPDKQLWNVDEQGLWSFFGGHWRLALPSRPPNRGKVAPLRAPTSTEIRKQGALRSALGEPLQFVEAFRPPFYGLPSTAASWVLLRLDSNEAGGVPLIDEVPVKVSGERVQLRSATVWGTKKEEFLLATDHGLCVFDVKLGSCERIAPEGLSEAVHLFMRDGTKRLWVGGRGLWILRDRGHADAIAIPMLADSEVVALAEAPDGRIAVGLANRGAVFLTIPPGWFQRPSLPPTLAPWESTRPHEALFEDRAVVLRSCRGKHGSGDEAARQALLAELRAAVHAPEARVRVALEETFDGDPDIAIRGADIEEILADVLPRVEKLGGKANLSVHKRFGSRGSASVEIKPCPGN